MRIHFSSSRPCALKLGGALAGYCGEAEKFVDVADGESVLAEFIPAAGDFQPLSFIINADFFSNPPACCDVYRYDCGADICAARFLPSDPCIKVLEQKRLGDTLATVFQNGGVRLSLENAKKFELFPLPYAEEYALGEEIIGGARFLSARCKLANKTLLCLFDGNLNEALRDKVSGYECGDTLCTRLEFSDIAGHTALRTYRAEQNALIAEKYEVHAREGFDPAALNEKLLPFAFFQEIAAGGDPAPYLAPALLAKKELLKGYLGEFCGVYLPKEIFYLAHGNVNAVGLIYKRTENAFDVKFFKTEIQGGTIVNLSPVE